MEFSEFIGKKLGEIIAFGRVGAESFERGRDAFESILGSDRVAELSRHHQASADALQQLVQNDAAKTAMEGKIEGTGKKLQHMRDFYIGDEWDNPTELCEWSGFFEGAAIVHCNLILGAAEKLDHAELIELIENQKKAHQEIFDTVNGKLKELGSEKA